MVTDFLINYFSQGRQDLGLSLPSDAYKSIQQQVKAGGGSLCKETACLRFSDGRVKQIKSDADLVEFVALPKDKTKLTRFVVEWLSYFCSVEVSKELSTELAKAALAGRGVECFLRNPFDRDFIAAQNITNKDLIKELYFIQYKIFRKRLGLGRKQLAAILGVSVRAIHYWEAGSVPVPLMVINFLALFEEFKSDKR